MKMEVEESGLSENDTKTKQKARSFLRERFLRLMTNITGGLF